MRLIAAIMFSMSMASAFGAGPPSQRIDLNRPGALEQLKQERPTHYEAIAEVLRVAEQAPCKAKELETLKARYQLGDLACSLLMTSDPPKRRLGFSLEGTRYVAVVTVKHPDGDAHSIHDRRAPNR